MISWPACRSRTAAGTVDELTPMLHLYLFSAAPDQIGLYKLAIYLLQSNLCKRIEACTTLL